MCNEDTNTHIAFIGYTLAPFFLQDPRIGNADTSFFLFATTNANELAHAWPFVNQSEALTCIQNMQASLAPCVTGEEKEDAPFIASDDLTEEYRRLFVGPGKKALPPWGSVYTDKECVMFGSTTIKLRLWMKECGLEYTKDDSMPEDHIGLMLSLMAYIAQNKPEKLDEYLENHFLTWAAHFLEKMEEVSTHAFYVNLARLTNASLKGIEQALHLSIIYPRFYK